MVKKLKAQEQKCAWVEGKEIKKRRYLLPGEFLALDGVVLNCCFYFFFLPVFNPLLSVCFYFFYIFNVASVSRA